MLSRLDRLVPKNPDHGTGRLEDVTSNESTDVQHRSTYIGSTLPLLYLCIPALASNGEQPNMTQKARAFRVRLPNRLKGGKQKPRLLCKPRYKPQKSGAFETRNIMHACGR